MPQGNQHSHLLLITVLGAVSAQFQSDCWDGTHFGTYGEPCSDGVYYYTLTYSRPIQNADSYDVSNFVESVFGKPYNNSQGRQRSGSILLTR